MTTKPSALDQAYSSAKNFAGSAASGFQKFASGFTQSLQSGWNSLQKSGVVGINNSPTITNYLKTSGQIVGNQAGNTVASIPYAIKNYQQSIIQKQGIPMDFNKVQQREDAIVKQIESKPKWQQPMAAQMLFEEYQPTSGQSAVPLPLINDITPIPKANPYLDSVKQKVLSNPNLRPSAREYLSKVPISYENMEKYKDNEGIAPSGLAHQKYVGISDTFSKPIVLTPEEQQATTVQQATMARTQELARIIQHELLHKTPRLVPTDLFKPENQPIINQYTNRWGKDYMDNPGALVEEMFAEQDLPPAYYWHIFKNLNPKATKQNFVDYLKSWFVNKISNSVPMPQDNGIQGINVPMSGGGAVQN